MIILTPSLRGQDPFYSQFFNQILYLNPAYAGSALQPRVAAGYRNQIPAMGSAYVTYAAAYDQPVEVLQGGVGLHVMNDVQANSLSRMNASLIYAYHLRLNREWMVNAGFQAGYSHRFLKTGDLRFPDGYAVDGNYYPELAGETYADDNSGYPDLAVGFIAYTRNIYGGVAMSHLTRPDLSVSRQEPQALPRKLTAHAGMYISLYERRLGQEAVRLNPNVVYVHQGGSRQLNYGLDVWYNHLQGGAWLRHDRDFRVASLIMRVGYQHDYFRIAYAHDFVLSKPWNTMSNMGAHEISFLLWLDTSGKTKGRQDAIKSPKI